MKVVATRMTLNILLWLFIWSIITWVMYSVEHMYYKYSPITNFIDFQKLDLADYNIWDDFQMVYAYRNSKIETIWDFTFKTICGWVWQSDWNSISENVLLQKTNWLEKITIQAPITNQLPIWECEVFTHIDLDIHWIEREINLYDKFIVLK
jgi:hypothetical protein